MTKPAMVSALLIASNFSMPAANNEGPIVPRTVRERTIAASIRVDVNMVLVPVSRAHRIVRTTGPSHRRGASIAAAA
jgi:hypothetical protein